MEFFFFFLLIIIITNQSVGTSVNLNRLGSVGEVKKWLDDAIASYSSCVGVSLTPSMSGGGGGSGGGMISRGVDSTALKEYNDKLVDFFSKQILILEKMTGEDVKRGNASQHFKGKKRTK